LNTVLSGGLLVITLVYEFPPPMPFAGAALVLFLVSLARQGRSPAA
jgi:hypothetical protein